MINLISQEPDLCYLPFEKHSSSSLTLDKVTYHLTTDLFLLCTFDEISSWELIHQSKINLTKRIKQRILSLLAHNYSMKFIVYYFYLFILFLLYLRYIYFIYYFLSIKCHCLSFSVLISLIFSPFNLIIFN